MKFLYIKVGPTEVKPKEFIPEGSNIEEDEVIPSFVPEIKIGLGWDMAKRGNGNVDLDGNAHILDKDGKEIGLVYYNTKNWKNLVVSGGDNLTGEGEGNDEEITIKLQDIAKKHPDVSRIVISVTVYTNQTFSVVKNEFCNASFKHPKTGKEVKLIDYNLDAMEELERERGIVFANIYKDANNNWRFQPIGKPVSIESAAHPKASDARDDIEELISNLTIK
ncbi:MAG: TerD family protein [Oligoflexales bacterium]